jgi:hypothetical protein
MADDNAPVTKIVYNTSDGPRSIISHDGSAMVIPAGGSAEVSARPGEFGDDMHPDLTTTKPKAARAAAASEAPAGSTNTDATADEKAKAIEELATQLVNGHDLKGLQAAAKADDVSYGKDDSPEQIALAIAQKRLGANE